VWPDHTPKMCRKKNFRHFDRKEIMSVHENSSLSFGMKLFNAIFDFIDH